MFKVLDLYETGKRINDLDLQPESLVLQVHQSVAFEQALPNVGDVEGNGSHGTLIYFLGRVSQPPRSRSSRLTPELSRLA